MLKIKGLLLRGERPEDYAAVEELTREAFWNHYAPGCDEHYLLHIMRDTDAFIPALDIVAEADGKIIGNIVYTKAVVEGDDGVRREVISFGPLSVLPEFQGRGVGSALVEYTIGAAKALGYQAIFIYGDPDYYSRFGFVPAERFQIGTADDMYMPALQALELVPGALSGAKGKFIEDAVYNVNEDAAKEFDKAFTPKELQDDLPSQIIFRQMVGQKTPRD